MLWNSFCNYIVITQIRISSLYRPKIINSNFFSFISDSKYIHISDMSPTVGISEEIQRSNSEINKEKCLGVHESRRPKSCTL